MFVQAKDGIRGLTETGVPQCALPFLFPVLYGVGTVLWLHQDAVFVVWLALENVSDLENGLTVLFPDLYAVGTVLWLHQNAVFIVWLTLENVSDPENGSAVLFPDLYAVGTFLWFHQNAVFISWWILVHMWTVATAIGVEFQCWAFASPVQGTMPVGG